MLDKKKRISMDRAKIEFCLGLLNKMQYKNFLPELEVSEILKGEPELQEEFRKLILLLTLPYRTASTKLYDELKAAMSVREQTRGPSAPKLPAKKRMLSRMDVFNAVKKKLGKEGMNQYCVTQNKVNSILNEITRGEEEGERFKRIREKSPRYNYDHVITEEVIEKIEEQGVAMKYVESKLKLPRRTLYSFLDKLCYYAFNGGTTYLLQNSSISQYFRENFTWDGSKGLPNNPLDVDKGTMRYRFTPAHCEELVKVLREKKAIERAQKKKR